MPDIYATEFLIYFKDDFLIYFMRVTFTVMKDHPLQVMQHFCAETSGLLWIYELTT